MGIGDWGLRIGDWEMEHGTWGRGGYGNATHAAAVDWAHAATRHGVPQSCVFSVLLKSLAGGLGPAVLSDVAFLWRHISNLSSLICEGWRPAVLFVAQVWVGGRHKGSPAPGGGCCRRCRCCSWRGAQTAGRHFCRRCCGRCRQADGRHGARGRRYCQAGWPAAGTAAGATAGTAAGASACCGAGCGRSSTQGGCQGWSQNCSCRTGSCVWAGCYCCCCCSYRCRCKQ